VDPAACFGQVLWEAPPLWQEVLTMFVPSFGVLVQAILLVAGLWWCKEMWDRFPADRKRLKESQDSGEKGVIIFFWVVTAGIVILIVTFAWGLLRAILAAL
jgi:hypothetical protein